MASSCPAPTPDIPRAGHESHTPAAHTQRRVPSGSRRMSTTPEPAHDPEPLWTPGPERIARAQVTRFQEWAADRHGAPAGVPGDPAGSYAALHAWSVREPEVF